MGEEDFDVNLDVNVSFLFGEQRSRRQSSVIVKTNIDLEIYG